MKRAETLEEIEQWSANKSSGSMLLSQNEKLPGGVIFADEDAPQPPVELKMKLLIESSDDSLYFEHTFNSDSEYEEAEELITRLREKFTLQNVDAETIDEKTS